MAVEVTLSTITTGYNLSKINTNFEAIQTALQDAISRSGSTPNTMSADLDMNGNDILNVNAIQVEALTINGETFVMDEAFAVGPPGEDASLTLGSVSTGAAGTDVIITNSGTTQDAVFNFTIPRGDKGESGPGTGDMLAAQNLNDVSDKPTAFSNIKQAATDSATGVVELATDAEAVTGTDTARAITPANGAVAYEAKGRYTRVQSMADADYTLVLLDAGALITDGITVAKTLTIPPQGSVAWLDNTRIDIHHLGAGELSIAPGSGVTLNSKDSKRRLNGRYSAATLIRTASNVWSLVGDIKT